MSDPSEIWRGCVNAWDCDEMGHMNVRFYVQRFAEGVSGLARLLGMESAFSPHATSTLLVRAHHLRFIKEARAGAPLFMTGGVAAITETGATLLQILRHAPDGAVAATALTEVDHVEPQSRKVFPWPGRVATAAVALHAETPEFAAPRSIRPASAPLGASLARADALSMTCIGRGAVRVDEVDVFGRLRPDAVVGRISDGVGVLLAEIRDAVKRSAPGSVERLGGAVLEYRLAYLDLPDVGAHLELRSVLAGVEAKTQRMVHWILNPSDGRPLAVSEAVAVNFDLDARAVVPISPEARAAMETKVVPGLRF